MPLIYPFFSILCTLSMLFLAWGGGVLACLSLGEAPRDLIDNLRRAGL